MKSTLSKCEAESGACRYVLLMLLQRLSGAHPGLIEELISGVSADRASVESQGRVDEDLGRVFAEALRLLVQAKGN